MAANWFGPGFGAVKVNFEWSVQLVEFLNLSHQINPISSEYKRKNWHVQSPLFSSSQVPHRRWRLQIYDWGSEIRITVSHYNQIIEYHPVRIGEPAVLVKISIFNDKNDQELLFQQMISSQPNANSLHFDLSKEVFLKPNIQLDDTITIAWVVQSFEENETESARLVQDYQDQPSINYSDQLATQLEGLLGDTKFSDFTFVIGSREFPVYKGILASRSQVFAAMFEYPTKENLTHRVVIEDVEPDVFQELLRFIYTGRVSMGKMDKFAAKLHTAADKYMLDHLKFACENHLIQRMSPENCLQLLLLNICHTAEHLKEEAVDFFRRHPMDVMATDGWKKLKQENLPWLCEIQEMALVYPSSAKKLRYTIHDE